MIPENRPVNGYDLDAIKQHLDLTTADACWLFGVSITKWTQVVRKNGDKPLDDPCLAMLVRFIDTHPEISILPRAPSAEDLYQMINSVVKTDYKRFAILLGNQASGGYRWIKLNGRQTPTLQRLMYMLRIALLSRPEAERPEILERWSGTVLNEGRTRGVDNVFVDGSWRPKKRRGADAQETDASDASEAPAKTSA